MRKICFLFIVCLCSIFVCAQKCEELTAEFEYLETKYKKLEKTTDKKECVKQLELVMRRAKEANCEFPQKWQKEVRQWKQALYPSSFFAQGSYSFESSNDVIQIGVKQKKNLKVVDNPSWLTFRETEDSKHLEFSMEENELPYPRSGIIVVEVSQKRHQCSVTQEAAPLIANVTERLGFGQDGGASFIFVETNDTAWTVSGDNGWIKSELTDYGARVVCTTNPNKQKRSAKLKVKLAHGEIRDVEVSQAIGRTTLSVPTKSYTFSNYGETNNNVKVNCNYDQWSASASENWVKVKKKYGGISIECLPNTVATYRSATVKIETNDAEHLVEYINVTQKEAPAYLSAEQSSYRSDGYNRTVNVKVNTNIPNWSYSVEKGGNWTTATKSGDNLKVNLRRNDWNSSRTSEIKLYGKGQSYTVSLYQPDRGYEGRYNDYFDANGGEWRLSWFCMEVGVLTSVGINVSTINFRWKPIEVSLLNANVNYNFLSGAICVGWEPIVRGFLPVSRNGKWAAFVGMGAHVDFMDDSHFLIEFGMDCQWNAKNSSRIFFKYNGGCVLGMSYDIGKWY